MIKVFPFKKIADKFLHNVKLDENYERIYDFIYNNGWEPIFGCVLDYSFYDLYNYALYYHLNNELRMFMFKIPENFNKMNGIIQTLEKRIKGKENILNNWMINQYMNVIHKLKLSNIFKDISKDISDKQKIRKYETKSILKEDGLLISNIVFYKMKSILEFDCKTKNIFVSIKNQKEGYYEFIINITNKEDCDKNKYLSLMFPKTFEYIDVLLNRKPSFLEKLKGCINEFRSTNYYK